MSSLLNPSKDDVLRLIEIAVIGLLTAMVLLMVVRPLVRKVIGPEAKRIGAAQALVASSGGGDPAAIGGPPRESQAARMIELAKVNGQVQQQSLERIGDLVKGNPAESVSVLRQWIHERS